MTKNFCFIPAKAASQRLKKKNLLKLNNKELIYYPIQAALQSGLFGQEVIVSTESPEIQKVALRYGAKVPYLREEKLAHDPYGVCDVVLDFLENFPSYRQYENLVIMLPTSPLVLAKDICNAYKIFLSNLFSVVHSVHELDHNALRAVQVSEDKQLSPLFPECVKKPSAHLEKTYWINGAVTIVRIDKLFEHRNYFIPPLGAYVLPQERAVDIDTEMDYRLAQLLMEQIQLRPATREDASLLLEWRNDLQTRQASRCTEKVEREEHLSWLNKVLQDKNRQIFIAQENGQPVGTARSDYHDGVYELSWTVAPHARGQGIGKKIVSKLVEQTPRPVRAEIKVGNMASVKIAEHVGMKFQGEVKGMWRYQLDF